MIDFLCRTHPLRHSIQCLNYCCWIISCCAVAVADEPLPGDLLLSKYFQQQCESLSNRCLADIHTAEDWSSRQAGYRAELQEMLGLSPWPERTPLNPTVTSRVEHDEFVVENLYFESLPGLYVTGNLFRPREVAKPLPAVLYVCGHYVMRKGKVSLGGKTMFQNHGAWFARNGYVCLIIDTIQLGEIEGIHHGTYDKGQWWWHSRGYVPGGPETWNGMRAIDYLQSRDEVDPERIGLTGRSGGGAMTCYLAALDERIQAAVPVAGITTIKNHIVDGCIENHCDCMYPVNTYHWDFPLLTALIAPRPLLIANQDKDPIFPLDGVVDVYSRTRKIYDLLGARDKIGLFIAEGRHHDVQEIQFASFHWFNRFLKGEKSEISMLATSFFPPEQLMAFESLPRNERVTRVQEWFVPEVDLLERTGSADEFMKSLQPAIELLERSRHTGGDLPELDLQLVSTQTDPNGKLRLRVCQFNSESPYRLSFSVLDHGEQNADSTVRFEILDEAAYQKWMAKFETIFNSQTQKDGDKESVCELSAFKGTSVFFAPRGAGESRWSSDPTRQIHIRRRFALLGTTEDLARVNDIIQALTAVQELFEGDRTPITLVGEKAGASWALHAALLSQYPSELILTNLPKDDQDSPQYLSLRQHASVTDVVAGVAALRGPVTLQCSDAPSIEFWKNCQAKTRKVGASKITVQFQPE